MWWDNVEKDGWDVVLLYLFKMPRISRHTPAEQSLDVWCGEGKKLLLATSIRECTAKCMTWGVAGKYARAHVLNHSWKTSLEFLHVCLDQLPLNLQACYCVSDVLWGGISNDSILFLHYLNGSALLGNLDTIGLWTSFDSSWTRRRLLIGHCVSLVAFLLCHVWHDDINIKDRSRGISNESYLPWIFPGPGSGRLYLMRSSRAKRTDESSDNGYTRTPCALRFCWSSTTSFIAQPQWKCPTQWILSNIYLLHQSGTRQRQVHVHKNSEHCLATVDGCAAKHVSHKGSIHIRIHTHAPHTLQH